LNDALGFIANSGRFQREIQIASVTKKTTHRNPIFLYPATPDQNTLSKKDYNARFARTI
jgi:hypothetical protein